MTILETSRLHIRRVNTGDAPFIYELLNTPGWLKYIGDRNVHNDDDARKYIEERMLPSFEKHGFGFGVVELKEENKPIGSCGLVKRDFLEHADIGFAFLPQYIGKGYGFEASFAMMNYAKDALNMNKLVAFASQNNENSIGLLRKLGMQPAGTIIYPGEQEELAFFEKKLNH